MSHFAVVHKETGALFAHGGEGFAASPPDGFETIEIPAPDAEHLTWDRETRCFGTTQWQAVFNAETGQLVSYGTDVAYPLPDGLAVRDLTGPPTHRHYWDPDAQNFVEQVESAVTAVPRKRARKR